MRRTAEIRANRAGMSMVEVIIAIMLLAATIFFIFEILITSYAHTGRMKYQTRLNKLTQAKLEDILYENAATDSAAWTKFTEDPDFEYLITTSVEASTSFFDQYRLTKVTVRTRGPVDRVGIPVYEYSLSSYLLDEDQSVTTTEERAWGQGLPTGGPGR